MKCILQIYFKLLQNTFKIHKYIKITTPCSTISSCGYFSVTSTSYFLSFFSCSNLTTARISLYVPPYSDIQVNKCISQEYVHTYLHWKHQSLTHNKMANMLNLLELQMNIYLVQQIRQKIVHFLIKAPKLVCMLL